MTRLTLTALALVAAASCTQFAHAQVIGTYRPSVVTYYPTSTSVTPAAYQPQIAQASYYGAATVATPVSSQPYYAAAPSTQSYYASPAVANGCQCTPMRSYPTNIAPTTYYSPAPVAYQQPVTYTQPVSYNVPVQTVAYNSQPALGSNRYIGTNLYGSPKVYANGQPLRNALRWLGP